MHTEARTWVARYAGDYERVVEFGALDINGGVCDLFRCDTYVGIDRQDGPGVTLVADAATWTTDRPVDLVLCCEVLEHADNGPEVVASAAAALRRGGLLLLTCATDPRAPHSGVDGGAVRDGEHYANVELGELMSWVAAAGLVSLEWVVDSSRGDLYVAAIKP